MLFSSPACASYSARSVTAAVSAGLPRTARAIAEKWLPVPPVKALPYRPSVVLARASE
jgi:hypothetical protein